MKVTQVLISRGPDGLIASYSSSSPAIKKRMRVNFADKDGTTLIRVSGTIDTIPQLFRKLSEATTRLAGMTDSFWNGIRVDVPVKTSIKIDTKGVTS